MIANISLNECKYFGGDLISAKAKLVFECTKFTLFSNKKEQRLIKRRVLTPGELYHICSYLERIKCTGMMYRMLEKHPYAAKQIADRYLQ